MEDFKYLIVSNEEELKTIAKLRQDGFEVKVLNKYTDKTSKIKFWKSTTGAIENRTQTPEEWEATRQHYLRCVTDGKKVVEGEVLGYLPFLTWREPGPDGDYLFDTEPFLWIGAASEEEMDLVYRATEEQRRKIDYETRLKNGTISQWFEITGDTEESAERRSQLKLNSLQEALQEIDELVTDGEYLKALEKLRYRKIIYKNSWINLSDEERGNLADHLSILVGKFPLKTNVKQRFGTQGRRIVVAEVYQEVNQQSVLDYVIESYGRQIMHSNVALEILRRFGLWKRGTTPLDEDQKEEFVLDLLEKTLQEVEEQKRVTRLNIAKQEIKLLGGSTSLVRQDTSPSEAETLLEKIKQSKLEEILQKMPGLRDFGNLQLLRIENPVE